MERDTNSSPCREQARLACNRIIDTSLRSLYQIWDKMGIDESQKKARGDTVVVHVKNLMQHMIAEETTLMNQVAKTIDEYAEKLEQLCNELSLPHIKLPGDLTMVQKEKILRAKVEKLTKDKTERMIQYDILHVKDQDLCEVLSATPYYIPPGKVPTLEQLKELEKHVANLQSEKDKRFLEFVSTKQKIIEFYNTMETEPDTSFGCELICEDDESFGLSVKNMENLKQLHDELMKKDKDMKNESDQLRERLRALWNRLETSDLDRDSFEMKTKGHGGKTISLLKKEIEACEILKFKNMKKFIEGLRTELKSWWDKCCFSKEQRAEFKELYKEEYTEEILLSHELELERVKKYYTTHKDILDKIAKREELFREMVAFEEKASDPNRFFSDRGGKLLQEEKARKKLMKELPKVEEEVSEVIQKWEHDNEKEFLVNGMRFPDYVKNQWENFQQQKEQQKQSRHKARTKQTQEEMMYGSKSVSQTPNKRKIPTTATPLRTPLKTRKAEKMPSISVKVKIQYDGLNDLTTKTPSTTGKLTDNSRYQHNTVLQSSAVRQPVYSQKAALTKSMKKRSVRLMQKAATRRNLSMRRSRDIFSPAADSKDDSTISLASHGSYNDFANFVSMSKASSPEIPHS